MFPRTSTLDLRITGVRQARQQGSVFATMRPRLRGPEKLMFSL